MDATPRLNPLIAGSTLALIISIMYSVCTGAWVIWYEGALR